MKIPTTSIQGAELTGVRNLHALAEEIPGVINLSMDQPDFETPEFIREAVKKALDDGYSSNFPVRGFRDLREAIAAKLRAENNIDAQPDTEIIVATATMPIVFSVCQHLISAGDEVILIDPGIDYGSQIQLFGGKSVRVPAYESNGFVVESEDIRLSINDKTKLIILNTPANPTGAVLDKTVLKEIANMAGEYNLWILVDESFEHIVFDGKKHLSIGSLDGMKNRTISVYSPFGSHAMAGWEVGYVVAPKAAIDEIENMSEQMGFGVAAIVQRVALAAMTAQRDLIRKRMKAYNKCRVIVHRGLNAIAGVSCPLPASTLFAFPNFSKLGLTSWNLARHLLREHKVALLPGSIFGNNGEGYLRLSYAVDPSVLIEAIMCIKKGAGQLLSY